MDLTNKLIAQQYTITGPGIKLGTDKNAVPVKFENFISQFIGILTIVAIIYFIIQIIFAGYAFMGSNGDSKKIEQAKAHLTQNILGLTIILVAVIITNIMGNLFGLGNILNFAENFNKIIPNN